MPISFQEVAQASLSHFEYALLAVAVHRWRWHCHLVQGVGLGMPILLHLVMQSLTMMEMAPPSLSRKRLAHHFTVNVLYLLLLCRGEGRVPISFKEVCRAFTSH